MSQVVTIAVAKMTPVPNIFAAQNIKWVRGVFFIFTVRTGMSIPMKDKVRIMNNPPTCSGRLYES